eukprot:s1693_g7.t1
MWQQHFSKAAGFPGMWNYGAGPGFMMVPPRSRGGGSDLRTIINSGQDLNQPINHLSSEDLMEIDEHLQSLIDEEDEIQAEEELWVAALEEGTLPSSRPREHKGSGSKASGGQGEDSENPSAGASSSSNPSGPSNSALPPAAEDDSSSDSEQEEAVGEDAPETAAEGATSKGPASGPASGPATGRKVRTMVMCPAWRRGSLAALEAMRMERLQKAGEKEPLELQLGQIRYSQDSIRGQFRDLRNLKVMREQLTAGRECKGSAGTAGADGKCWAQKRQVRTYFCLERQ